MKLTNASGVDSCQRICAVQPPWQLTIVSRLFRRVLAAYNSRIVSSNTTSGVTTFEVTDPRFVLEKRESSAVSILFLADGRANEQKVWLWPVLWSASVVRLPRVRWQGT